VFTAVCTERHFKCPCCYIFFKHNNVQFALSAAQVSAGSPTATDATPEKKKKKRGFRMPSFSSKKKDK